MNELEEKLFLLAKDHLADAYSPYSHFHVASALVTDAGEIFTGVNIENSSFGLTNCAERTAIFSWVNAGRPGKIKCLLIIGNTDRPISPCGACRQVMAEFRIPRIYLTNIQGQYRSATVADLLPDDFSL